ncbi:MAG TPA: phosphoglycerate kinase, partial [Saprospiraceae bacterium]|nr:phosphoglycerate kinase [Saprospiraceae bacterium]
MQNLDLVGKRILVRVDFNVPLDNHLNVTDNKRIREALPTIEYLLSLDGVSVILMSHLGRPLKKLLPDGSIDVQKFSLRNIIPELSKLLGREVLFAENCIGEKTEAIAKSLIAGQVLLLENTRFHKEEEKGDEEFSRQLASLGQAYINDAFGTAHRAHASTCIIARYFAKNV